MRRRIAPIRSAPRIALTAELRERIEALVVHLDDVAQAPIVDAVFDVFGAAWLADPRVLPEIGDRATRRIELKRAIAQAIEYYARFQPAWALAAQRRIDAYRAALERLRISDEMLHRDVGALPLLRQTLPVAIVGVLGAPLAGFGWLLNGCRASSHGGSRSASPRGRRRWRSPRCRSVCRPSHSATRARSRAAPLQPARSHRAGARGTALPAIGFLSNRYFALIRHYLENLRLTSLHLLRRGRLEQLRFARQQLDQDQEKMRSFLVAPPQDEAALPTA